MIDSDTKVNLVAAANLLIRSPNAHYLHNVVVNTAPLVARYPEMKLTGEAAPLTVLARLKVSEPDVYQGVIDLVERRREEAGLEPLVPAYEPHFDKTAYMQEFMEKKRSRLRKAAEIENSMRPERDRLVGRARLDFMQRQAELWKRERDELLQRARRAARPRRLTRDEIQIVLRQFWDGIDAKLETLATVARARGVTASGASLSDLDDVIRYSPHSG